ncbi:MAG: hypothetical protein M3N12_07535 [Verrucomicrobiota bacterium]|nr:hypothetical protein [Verrucomicrobiota bacterium]
MQRFPTIRHAFLALMFGMIGLMVLAASRPAGAETDVATGTARGSLTYKGHTAELKFAAAFVDQKDSDKPTVVLLTDTKLTADQWTSEFDMMRDKTRWNGIVFFLVDGVAIRSDIHLNNEQASVSGIFTFKLDKPAGKELTGKAVTDEGAKDAKLDATFHATLK